MRSSKKKKIKRLRVKSASQFSGRLLSRAGTLGLARESTTPNSKRSSVDSTTLDRRKSMRSKSNAKMPS